MDMSWYLDFLGWIVYNPVKAFFLLIAEFCLMYWVYYRTGENPVLQFVCGVFFTPQNFVFNMVVMTMIGLLDMPHEGASTLRAKRWKKEYISREGYVLGFWPAPDWVMDWRNYFAHSVCRILNRFDPGHC